MNLNSSFSVKQFLERKEILIFLGIILLALFYAKQLFQKQQDKIKRINLEMAAEQSRLDLAKELLELDHKLTQASDPYFEKDTSFNIDKLKEIISQCGVKITAVSITKEQGELHERTRYQLSLQTKYHNLGKLISALESVPDMVSIEDVLVVPQQQTAQDEKVILDVPMRISAVFIKL